jgi:hypothetical protein
MSNQEEFDSGEGGAEGVSSGRAESGEDEAVREDEGHIEMPLGMPVTPEEIARLKAAAERHRDQDEDEPPAQSDSS